MRRNKKIPNAKGRGNPHQQHQRQHALGNAALRAKTARHIATQIKQAVSVGRVGEQQRIEQILANMLPLVGNKHTEQAKS